MFDKNIMSYNSNRFCGGHSERETPVPIPNTAVKTLSADDTTGATPWESRKPPRFPFWISPDFQSFEKPSRILKMF